MTYKLKVYDQSIPGYPRIDQGRIIAALGDLYAGECVPYGDDSETILVSLTNASNVVVDEAVKRLNALGYQTDED